MDCPWPTDPWPKLKSRHTKRTSNSWSVTVSWTTRSWWVPQMYPFKVNACHNMLVLIFPSNACISSQMNLVCRCATLFFFAPQPAGFVEVGIHYPDRAKTPAKGQHAGVAAANGKEFYFLGPLSKVHYLLSQPQQSHFFCSDASATATEALHCKLWNLQPSPTPRSQPRFDWFLDPLWSSEASWTLATRSSGPWSWHQLRGPCWLCSTSGGRAGRCWMITYWSLCRDWVWWLHVTTGYRSLQSFGSTNHTCMNDACRMLAIRSIRLLNPLSVVLLAFSFMFS